MATIPLWHIQLPRQQRNLMSDGLRIFADECKCPQSADGSNALICENLSPLWSHIFSYA